MHSPGILSPWERDLKMNRLFWLFCARVRPFGIVILHARESEGTRTNSVLLNGQWEFVLG